MTTNTKNQFKFAYIQVSIFLACQLIFAAVPKYAHANFDSCNKYFGKVLDNSSFTKDPDIEANHKISRGLKRAGIISKILNSRESLEDLILSGRIFRMAKLSLNQILELTNAPVEGWLTVNSDYSKEGREAAELFRKNGNQDFVAFHQNQSFKSLLDAVKGLFLILAHQETSPSVGFLVDGFQRNFDSVTHEMKTYKTTIWVTAQKQSTQTILEYLAKNIHIIEIRTPEPGTFAIRDVTLATQAIKIFNLERVKWLDTLLPEVEKIEDLHLRRLVLLQIFSLRENPLQSLSEFSKKDFTGSFAGSHAKLKDLEAKYGSETVAPLKEQSIEWLKNYLSIHPFPKGNMNPF